MVTDFTRVTFAISRIFQIVFYMYKWKTFWSSYLKIHLVNSTTTPQYERRFVKIELCFFFQLTNYVPVTLKRDYCRSGFPWHESKMSNVIYRNYLLERKSYIDLRKNVLLIALLIVRRTLNRRCKITGIIWTLLKELSYEIR